MILEESITIHTIFYYAIHTYYTHTTHILHTIILRLSLILCCKWSIYWKRKNPTFCRIQKNIQILPTKGSLSLLKTSPRDSSLEKHWVQTRVTEIIIEESLKKQKMSSDDFFEKVIGIARNIFLSIKTELNYRRNPWKKLSQSKKYHQNPKKCRAILFF